MKELARQLYFWPGMSTEIVNLVDRCEECQELRSSKPPEPFQYYDIPDEPMISLSTDLFHNGGRDYLLIVDRFSGYPWVNELRTLQTSAVTRALRKLFLEFGFPLSILSDNGPQFGAEFNEFCEAHDIEHATSSPYNSKSNGLAESAVKNVKYLLKKCGNLEDFWPRLHELRNVPSRNSPYSPAQRFFGRRTRGLLPTLPPPPMRAEASGGGQTHDDTFRPGLRVRIQCPHSHRWLYKGTIISARQSGRSFEIERDDGERIVRNRCFLKLLSGGPTPPLPPPESISGRNSPNSVSSFGRMNQQEDSRSDPPPADRKLNQFRAGSGSESLSQAGNSARLGEQEEVSHRGATPRGPKRGTRGRPPTAKAPAPSLSTPSTPSGSSPTTETSTSPPSASTKSRGSRKRHKEKTQPSRRSARLADKAAAN